MLLIGGYALYRASDRLWGEGLTRQDIQILRARGLDTSGRVTAVGTRGFHLYQTPIARIRFSTVDGERTFETEGDYEIKDQVPVIFDPQDPGRAAPAARIGNDSEDRTLPRFKGNPDAVRLIGLVALLVGFFILVTNI